MRPLQGATLSEIEAVYRERFAEFRRVAAAIVGDRDAALDVVQDAFGTAIRRRHTFRRRGALEAWIWRIVVNTARDRRRVAARVATGAVGAAGNGHDDQGTLAVAVALLPERQRLAVFLRYYADLDYETIGDTLGISTGTVAASLNAAHAALRRALTEVSQ